LKYINNHNADEKSGKFSFTLRMNKFGDLTSLEFRKIYNGFNKTKNMNKPGGGFLFQRPMDWPMPQLVDLRQDGLVTGVKDQGLLGISCRRKFIKVNC
jgi:cathepsin L